MVANYIILILRVSVFQTMFRLTRAIYCSRFFKSLNSSSGQMKYLFFVGLYDR